MADSQSLPFAAATGTGAEKKQGRITQIVLSLIIFAGFVVLLFVPDAPAAQALSSTRSSTCSAPTSIRPSFPQRSTR